MHRSRNKYNAIDDKHLSERIIWYVEYCHELGDYHDQFPAEIDLMQLSGMQQKMKQKWVHHLDIVTNAWKIERTNEGESHSDHQLLSAGEEHKNGNGTGF